MKKLQFVRYQKQEYTDEVWAVLQKQQTSLKNETIVADYDITVSGQILVLASGNFVAQSCQRDDDTDRYYIVQETPVDVFALREAELITHAQYIAQQAHTRTLQTQSDFELFKRLKNQFEPKGGKPK